MAPRERAADEPSATAGQSGSWIETLPRGYRLRRGGLALAFGASLAVWIWARQWQLGFFPEKAWAGFLPLAVGAYRLLVWLSRKTVRRYRTIYTVFSLRERIRRAMPWWLASVTTCLFVWAAQCIEAHLQYWWYVWPLGIVFLIGCGIFLVRGEESLTPEAIKEMSWHHLNPQFQEQSPLHIFGVWLGRIVRRIRDVPLPEGLRIVVDEACRLARLRAVRYPLAVLLLLLAMSAWNAGSIGPVAPYGILALAWLAAHELMNALLRLWPLAIGVMAVFWLWAYVADGIDISPVGIAVAISVFVAKLLQRLR